MGLAERRAVKAYQDLQYPALKKAIDDAAGFEVVLEVEWDKIATEGRAAQYHEDWFWTQIYFQPLAAALKLVAQDDMGKAALKAGLKKVVITYDEATAPISNYKDGWKFDGGVLTLNSAPATNAGDETSSDFKERVDAIQTNLEAKL